MPNTYTQIYVQVIFAVKGRTRQISECYRDQLEKYICGIVKNKRSKPISIYCNPDHLHLLIGLHPSCSVMELVRDIKSNSTLWINSKNWFHGNFFWQEGYGAFSYSKAQIDAVVKYIERQPIHHKTASFKEEYFKLLVDYDISFDEQYLFKWD